MAPQQEKKPKDDQENQRPKEKGQSGIKKFFPDGKVQQKDDIEKLEKGLATMNPEKAGAVLSQAVISDNTGRTTSGDNDQASQSNHDAPEKDANHPPPPAIHEPSDIEMQDLNPQNSTKSQPSPTRQHADIPLKREDTTHLAPPEGDDILQTTHSPPSQYEEGCLAVLAPKKQEQKQTKDSRVKEGDEDVDIVGWGTLNRSSFIIIQEGPFSAAQYRFERRKGYSHPTKVCISDPAERISWLKDKDPSGKRVSRYTRENVAGIYGIVCSDGKRKCTWMMIKWKDIREEDAKKLKRGCSWERKSDLDRFFFSKKEAEEKRLEIWKNQKSRYAEYQKGKLPKFDSQGRHIDERSPTPCPIEETIDQHRKRRGTHQGRDAVEAKDEMSASGKQATDLQPDDSAIKTKEEFMEQHMKKMGWESLDDLEKEKKKVKLEALWDVYLEEVRKSGKASGKVAE